MEKLLLKPIEVCDVTGLGKSKCYALIAEGVIPSVRIGRAVRVPAGALRRWVESLAKGSAPGEVRGPALPPRPEDSARPAG
jgi:excisionase family DNA binding protein